MAELRLENVSYTYPGAEGAALRGVSACFPAGRLTAVVGPSGSGKTTLLSLLAGLDRPTEGRVTLDGVDVAAMDGDAYRRQRVAVVYQSFQLFPLLTALENAACPMELQGLPARQAEERARQLLRAVDIGESQERRLPARLSGGEQQRVAIARALGSGAGVILADEPTGNLDGENSRAIVALLAGLARERGCCVVAVTHDLEAARQADAVYALRDGRLEPAEPGDI